MVTTPFAAAANAYGSAAKLIGQGSQMPSGGLSGAGAPDFSKMLSESLDGVSALGQRSDAMALDMVSGKANVVDMVTAISETEIAIETMVTVRDRVIQAYEEIMRMPI